MQGHIIQVLITLISRNGNFATKITIVSNSYMIYINVRPHVIFVSILFSTDLICHCNKFLSFPLSFWYCYNWISWLTILTRFCPVWNWLFYVGPRAITFSWSKSTSNEIRWTTFWLHSNYILTTFWLQDKKKTKKTKGTKKQENAKETKKDIKDSKRQKKKKRRKKRQ